MPGGVIRLGDFIQRVQLRQGGRVVFGAFKNDADEAADVVTQMFRTDVNACAGNDPRLLHLLYADVNGSRADAKLFCQFGVGGTGIGH